MKRLALILAGVAVAGGLAATPAVAGLAGNPSFSHEIPVPVPRAAKAPLFADDRSGDGPHRGAVPRHAEPGDDHAGVTTHAEPADDHGGTPPPAEPSDDRGGVTPHAEPADNHGGATLRTETGDDHGGLQGGRR